ncbi:unnamed protein product [Rotaria sordida]|uniref:Uncharacterized protein n=1 Tax=Rotaria sordida TaxID=392033 RepID=A0A815K9F1_9BILA|nr:unnamed protein product [Rotaria sordida]CAF1401930.1 unnamed protein product [Rotaria sordida]CAF3837799.1 unnamed protein product [Rotaria sordida]CAF3935505.1 unnamed protein product [Rotaria sordida]
MAESNDNDNYYWNKNLVRTLKQYPDHQQRSFRNADLIDKDIPIIVQEALINKQCIELDMSSNRLTSEGARLLANAFEQNTVLEMLDLSNNRIRDEGVQHLVTTLRTYRHLKHLRLGTNAITDIGAEHLARLLLENGLLKLLELSSNELTSRGVITLVQAVPHSRLEYFYIEGNRQVNDECIDAIIVMIRQSKYLKSISLADIDFSQKSKEKLRHVVKSKHPSFLYI